MKRRNVIRVALFYIVTAWLALQIADLLFDLLGLPDWSLRLVFGLLAVGFPIALVFSWVFELTPDGVVRESLVDRSRSDVVNTGRKLNLATVVLLSVAVGLLLFQSFAGRGLGQPEPAGTDAAGAVTASAPDGVSGMAESPPADDRPSIAVLPFRNMSPDPDQVYFSEGLSDTLIHVLAQVDELRVAARTSSFAFQDRAVDVRDIARELNVGAILEGSVQRAGNRLRIIAQLVDASDGSHLWSGNFDRSAVDIFAVQDEIAREVLSALKSRLLEVAETEIAARYRPTMEAYEQFLLGRQKLATRRSAQIIEAEAHFREAHALDPNYALALVNLADAIYLQGEYAGRDRGEVTEESLPLVRAALALDPTLGEAHASLGNRQHQGMDQAEAAEASFLRAIELAPNYATTYHWYGLLLRDENRFDEALAMLRKAAELDPLHTAIRVVLWGELERLGRWEEADRVARQSLERDPDNVHFLTVRAWQQYRSGDLVASTATYERIMEVDPGRPIPLGGYCDVLQDLPDLALARDCVARYSEAFPDRPPYPAIWLDIVAMDLASATERIRRHGESASAADTHWNRSLAVVRWLQRDWQGSLEAWIALDPKYGDARPELDENNWHGWPAVAWLHSRLGNDEIVRHLSEALWPILESRRSRTRGDALGFADATLYLAESRTEEALAALTEAVDAGHRGGLLLVLVKSPAFELMHDDPRYQALVARVEADLAEQQAAIEARLIVEG